jgi:Domain of unknown function (4846)
MKCQLIFCMTGIIALLAGDNPYPMVGQIPLPAGYHRIAADKGSFGAWLREIRLKKDRTVYLYDGSPKRNQDAQFAVLDVSVGHKDLQQCADAVMRLRAEYLYGLQLFRLIDFYTEQGVRLNFAQWAAARKVDLSDEKRRRVCFDAYLETVFSYCSTRTLEKQLVPAGPFAGLAAGEVLIRGGAPGHAMLIIDVAEDSQGHRIYLLAQSYMPAQDIHIVRNPSDAALSPWYRADDAKPVIETPEWTFTTNQLRTWPGK